MRKTILILVLIVALTEVITSCASYNRSSGNGCKATQGYVGYGH
jgi:predicted small secreted protein